MEYIQADIWVRFQRLQGHEVHFMGADDAHGAPIMLAAEKAGKSPEEFVDAIQKARRPYLDGFHISHDNWHSTHSPENTELSQDIFRRLKAAGLVYTQAGRAVFRPGEGHVPRRPLPQGRMPELRREGPVRRCLRELQHGLLGDRAEESLLDAVGREAAAQVLAALLLQAVRPEVQSFVREWLETPGRLQSQVVNKAKEWLDGTGDKALADWDISRDPPYFGIRVPDIAEEKYLYVWLDAPIGYLASLKNYCARKGLDFEKTLRRKRADPLHRQGHHLLPHPVLAGDAEVRRPALQGARPRVRARLHHRVGRQDVQVARHRHRPAALPAPGDEPRVAALLHRRQAERQCRGHRLQSRRLHRAGEQRPGRQVRQHRQPLRGVHQPEVRRQAARTAASASISLRRRTRSRRCTRRASSARRCAR